MKAGLRGKIHEVYVDPLPYTLKPMPPVFIHNPVSILYYVYKLFVGPDPKQVVVTGVVDFDDPTRSVRVYHREHMFRLWEMGFFGKGSLSRSEPSWFGRTARRLGLDGGELTFEELTEMRRQKRRQFKRERERQEQRDLGNKLLAEGKVEEARQILAQANDDLPQMAPADVRREDQALICGNTVVKLEYLQLMPCEVVFLSVGLGVFEVVEQDATQPLDLRTLVSYFCDGRLLLEYVAYHYFRSLGWCVRSGVKFGTDFILYSRGPPFLHAEFAVNIVFEGCTERHDWWWAQQVARVVSGVKKSLVFAHIAGPDPSTVDWENITSVGKFRSLLQQYSVDTVLYSRWAPTRTRD